MRLLMGVVAGRQRRRRVRDIVVLCIRCVAIVFLLLALAGILFRGSFLSDAQRPVFIILDASASMQQQHTDGSSSWQSSKVLASRLLDRFAGRPLAFIVAGVSIDSSSTVLRMDVAAARALLGEAECGLGDGHISEAIRRASAMLSAHAQSLSVALAADCYFITDGSRSSYAGVDPEALPQGLRFIPVHVGQGAGNAGITALRVEPALSVRGVPMRIHARVSNYFDHPIKARVDIQCADDIQQIPCTIPAGASIDVHREWIAEESGQYQVRAQLTIFPESHNQGSQNLDALAVDNVRYGVVSVQQARQATIISDIDSTDASAVVRPVIAALEAASYSVEVFDTNALLDGAQVNGLLITCGLKDAQRLQAIQTLIPRHVQQGGVWVHILDTEADRALCTLMDGITPPFVPTEICDISSQERGYSMWSQARFDHPALEAFRARPDMLRSVHTYRYYLTGHGQAADADVLLAYEDGSIALAWRSVGAGSWYLWNGSPAAIASNAANQVAFPLVLAGLARAAEPDHGRNMSRDIGDPIFTERIFIDSAQQQYMPIDGSVRFSQTGIYHTQTTATLTTTTSTASTADFKPSELMALAIPALESDCRLFPSVWNTGQGAGGAESAEAEYALEEILHNTQETPLWSWCLFIALILFLIEMLLISSIGKRVRLVTSSTSSSPPTTTTTGSGG